MICQVYPDMGNLPHLNPDQDFEPLPEGVVGLRGQIGAADAVPKDFHGPRALGYGAGCFAQKSGVKQGGAVGVGLVFGNSEK